MQQASAASKASDIYARARAMIPGQAERDQRANEERAAGEGLPKCCGSLTYKQRLMGWACCSGLGTLFSVICIFMVTKIFTRPEKFAVPYTLGNIFTLAGTFFLAGPKKQLKRMSKEHRRVCVLCYLTTMILVIVLAVAWRENTQLKGLVMFILIIFQGVCVVWYVFTYIPGGQRMLKECCKCGGRQAAGAMGLAK
eukprot:g3134.t1